MASQGIQHSRTLECTFIFHRIRPILPIDASWRDFTERGRLHVPLERSWLPPKYYLDHDPSYKYPNYARIDACNLHNAKGNQLSIILR